MFLSRPETPQYDCTPKTILAKILGLVVTNSLSALLREPPESWCPVFGKNEEKNTLVGTERKTNSKCVANIFNQELRRFSLEKYQKLSPNSI